MRFLKQRIVLFFIWIASLHASSGILIHSNGIDPEMINGIAIPSDFPKPDISVNTTPETGFIFIGLLREPPYKLILDNDGAPVWFQRDTGTTDFKLQPNGWITYLDTRLPNGGAYIALDSTYTRVHTLISPPGYTIDSHECTVLPDGHYFVIGTKHRTVDMSTQVSGGNPAALIRQNYVIEMDENDTPVLIWRPSDSQFKITDAVYEDLTQEYIDYLHINAIAVDLDGNLLVSIRHFSEVVKIDRNTGAVIWRLGGAHDSFSWNGNIEKFSYQHDIRVLPNGHYTVFDNGNHHSWHYSRALELSVDPAAKQVTPIWEYRNDPNLQSRQQGSFQVLPGGNRVICWGDYNMPVFTEVMENGGKVYEIAFPDDQIAYRAHRFSWHGVAAVPQLLLEPYLDRLTLIFNQFGAQDIAYYNIYAAQHSGADQLIATTTQPFIHIVDEIENEKKYYFRVTSVNTEGKESLFSNEESVFFQVLDPRDNLIKNGDFSNGKNNWSFYQQSGSSGGWSVNDSGELQVTVNNGGTELWHVSVRQSNIPLVMGRTYQLEFDAHAETGRVFSAGLQQAKSPYTDYSRLGNMWIDGKPTHYSYSFAMEEATDTEALLSLNAGMSDVDVYLDNISLTMVLEENDADAGFSAEPVTGKSPLSVQFSDQSTGNILSWLWNFGDGGTSREQNPLHVYNDTGIFDVRLTVTGPGGSFSENKDHYITVTEGAPSAAFSANPTSGIFPLEVQFTDQSSGAVTAWQWNFGDGHTSVQQHPLHVYSNAGIYAVQLTVTGPGGSSEEIKSAYISVSTPAAPIAGFTISPAQGVIPLNVRFTDESTGWITARLWDFGDGGTSTEQNPEHVYGQAGSYTVSLTVTGPGGTSAKNLKQGILAVEPAPAADFTADKQKGIIPLEVRFSDQSAGAVTSWQWDFGDGQTSAQKNPTHIYQDADSFTVQLTAGGPGGVDTAIKENFIVSLHVPLLAVFTADTTTGAIPLEVHFTDQSDGEVTSWLWDFGDGETSAGQHPVHVYDTPGSFTVCLTIHGPAGISIETKPNCVIATEIPPVAAFSADTTTGIQSLNVHFSDQSGGTITSWLWNFGDGSTSAEQNPAHHYWQAGFYTVSLTVTGPGGSDTETKSQYIVIAESKPTAAFIAESNTGNAPFQARFINQSAGLIDSYFWEFGDGGTSSQKDPAYVYKHSGQYTVILSVFGFGGIDAMTKEQYITVNEPPPVAAFSVDTTRGNMPLRVVFTDQSTGSVDYWLWDFGDGGISTEQHPAHTYQYADSFAVSLTVSGPGGTHVKQIKNYIIVEEGTGIQKINTNRPDHFALLPNYPNPFNAETLITFSIPEPSPVRLTIYDISGKPVELLFETVCGEGTYRVTWNASACSAGIYLIRIESGNFFRIRKALLVK